MNDALFKSCIKYSIHVDYEVFYKELSTARYLGSQFLVMNM